MTTQHDYKAALEDIQEGTFSHGNLTYTACVHALRLADAVQRGPSEGMVRATGYYLDTITGPEHCRGQIIDDWNAMIAKLLEEIEG